VERWQLCRNLENDPRRSAEPQRISQPNAGHGWGATHSGPAIGGCRLRLGAEPLDLGRRFDRECPDSGVSYGCSPSEFQPRRRGTVPDPARGNATDQGPRRRVSRPIFDRTGGCISLTAVGEAMLPIAEKMKTLSDEAVTAAARAYRQHAGELFPRLFPDYRPISLAEIRCRLSAYSSERAHHCAEWKQRGDAGSSHRARDRARSYR